MATKPGRSKSTKQPKSRLRKIVKVVAIVVAVLVACALLVQWHISAIAAYRAKHKAPAPVSTSTVVHTPAEAVNAAKMVYDYYLPIKIDKVTQVGDNPLVEPALVQAVRASEVGFTPDFYNQLLDDYTKQYQASGKVTKDEVSCVSNATAADSEVLASSDAHDAIVNVTLKRADGSTLLVPVTMDLSTLKAKKIACP